jgi:hypothetical protein
VIDTLRYLRLEVDGLLDVVQGQTAAFVTQVQILERVQQLFFNWFSLVRPGLLGINLPVEVLENSDEAFKRLARLTASRSHKADYVSVLRALKRKYIKGLLLEVARVRWDAGAPVASPAPILPEIPDVPNEFIPNALFGWIPNMKGFLQRYSFDRNVFIMVSYRQQLSTLINRVKSALEEEGLQGIVAREHNLTDDLYNPIACLLCCNYGIAIFDRPEARQAHNPNVVYELGMMQFLKRRCLILKHEGLRTMPSDILSRLYESYGSQQEAISRVRNWWKRTSM